MVEWKKLGEVCVSLRKEIIKQGDLKDDGKYPVVNSGITLYGYYDDYNNEANAFTVASRGEYAGFITYMNDNFWAGGLCYPYRSKNESICLTKYMYSYLKNKERYIMDTLVMRGGIPALNKADVDKILIPIPSLSEQQRIVSILDTFTSSISNLKQQIEERRKQYEYERDLLLDLEGKEGVEMKKLGEVFSFKNGLNKGKEFFGKGKPIIMFTNVFNSRFITKAMIKSRVDISEQELERINAQIGDVFFTRTSETKEDVGYASVLVEDMEECTFAGFLIRARPITHKMLPQYCKYCFSTPKVRNAIVSKSSFTTRASLTGSGLGEVIIPLPPLSTQSRIVSILDTFEQSISNLEEQLAMREKQYGYYRNQLLTFFWGEEERGKT